MIVFTELSPTSSAHVQLVGFVERLYDEERRGGHSYGEVDGVVVHPGYALKPQGQQCYSRNLTIVVVTVTGLYSPII